MTLKNIWNIYCIYIYTFHANILTKLTLNLHGVGDLPDSRTMGRVGDIQPSQMMLLMQGLLPLGSCVFLPFFFTSWQNHSHPPWPPIAPGLNGM